MNNGECIVIPLDVSDLESAERLVRGLQPIVGMFKIGKQLFTAAGPAAVELVRGLGAEVFLDLKWHDIPNTVAAACRAAAELDVAMLNVHASGGAAMLDASRNALDKTVGSRRPKLLAVTVLTSLDAADLFSIGIHASSTEQVALLARLALGCGADGLICSPLEVSGLRREHGPAPTLVVPGVRPEWAAVNDQRRAATPAQAIAAGADYLVIGRPVTASDDPQQAALRVVAELQQLSA